MDMKKARKHAQRATRRLYWLQRSDPMWSEEDLIQEALIALWLRAPDPDRPQHWGRVARSALYDLTRLKLQRAALHARRRTITEDGLYSACDSQARPSEATVELLWIQKRFGDPERLAVWLGNGLPPSGSRASEYRARAKMREAIKQAAMAA